jgi:endonuclease G, mitochondrial
MIKQLLTAFAFAVTTTATWADINTRCPEFTAHGAPVHQAAAQDQQLCRQNYAVIHVCSVKNPVAVMERVTPESVNGAARRRDNFREDPEVHAECRSRLSDYAGSGYDRGHLAPAANNTINAEIMSESFFLSNMIPQNANNNRGIWRILELQIRDHVRQTGETVYVISGAVFDNGHKTIGAGVGVPTRLYKVVINKQSSTVTAYLMPNSAIPVRDLPEYQVPVSEVEAATGLTFPLK